MGGPGSGRSLAHHVVSDIEAEGSGSLVDEGGRVEGEGGQADVEHPAGVGRQREALGRERRLLVPSDVVELALEGWEEETFSTRAGFFPF